MHSDEWKLPLNIAIGLHLLVVVAMIYLPDLLKGKPKFAEIQTVRLISISEPTPVINKQPEPEVKEIEPTPKKIVTAKKVAPIAEAPKKIKTTPAKIVSLKPRSKKIVKPVKKKPKPKPIERKKRDYIKASAEEKLLAEKARLAREALEEEKRLLSNSNSPSRPLAKKKTSGAKRSTPSSSSSSTLVEARYQAALVARLQLFWKVPEYLKKDSNLSATVILTIRKNGRVADMFFEKKSKNKIFDQFVRKTIQEANPMPPIPSAMKLQRYEIGVRFRPEFIQ